jgi:hypothetical protein
VNRRSGGRCTTRSRRDRSRSPSCSGRRRREARSKPEEGGSPCRGRSSVASCTAARIDPGSDWFAREKRRLGAAVTGSSAALAAVFFLLITVGAALAYLIAGSGNNAATSGLNDLAWACVVIVSFPAAMLIMAGTFGLWWAGLISKRSSGPDWQRSYSSCWAEQRGLATDFWHGTVLIRSSSRRDRPCVGDGRQRALLRTGSLFGVQ